MFVVIWLFFAKGAAYKFARAMYRVDRTATLSDAETRVGNMSRYRLGFRIQCDVMVHFQHDFKICVRYHVLFMKGWCLYSSSVKQCLLSVNRDQFLRQLKENGKHKTTFHSTSGWESSLGKIYHRNSTAARTGTWNLARATKKTSSKWLWNTRLIQLHKLQIACMAEKTAVSILIVR